MNLAGAGKCHLIWGGVRWLACMTSIWRFWCFDIIFVNLTSFSHPFLPNISMSTYKRAKPKISWSKNCSYFSVKLIKKHIFKPKCNCQKKSMQEKESVMVVWFELKIQSLGITVHDCSDTAVLKWRTGSTHFIPKSHFERVNESVSLFFFAFSLTFLHNTDKKPNLQFTHLKFITVSAIFSYYTKS